MKKGVELSANFLVVMILSIVVLIGGIFLTTKLVDTGTGIQKDLDAQTKNQILSHLNDGSRVAIPIKTVETKRGSLATFGMGVRNVNDDPKDNKFKIMVIFSESFNAKDEKMCEVTSYAGGGPIVTQNILGSNCDWLKPNSNNIFYDSSENIINKNGEHYYTVGIKPPKNVVQGQYIFNVYVYFINGIKGLAPDDKDNYNYLDNEEFITTNYGTQQPRKIILIVN